MIYQDTLTLIKHEAEAGEVTGYVQFREGEEAYLYSEQEWFNYDLLPNFRRAIIEASSLEELEMAFASLGQACLNANPTIDWENVSPLVKEF